MRRISSAKEAFDEIQKLPNRSIGHIVLAGHGKRTALAWGDTGGILHYGGLRVSGDHRSTYDFLRALRGKLIMNAHVLIESCSAAEWGILGPSLFNYVTAQLAGARVSASG